MKAASPESFPDFDREVPKNGYAWWYVDALSDDGQRALTIIAFIGSVFSPYYAWARNRGAADPLDHCSLNVALYGNRINRWSMTERSREAVYRSARILRIGPNSLDWDGECLTFVIDETTAPFPSRIRGRVRIRPACLTGLEFKLDSEGLHLWRPIAPCSRVEVALTHPRWNWSGNAYWDSNTGARPLEDDFASWNWSRSSRIDGTTILYEGVCLPERTFSLALTVNPDGGVERFTPPDTAQLAATRWWRVARRTRADNGEAKVLATLEDTPFYTRSLLRSRLSGRKAIAVHESLSLDRFRRAWVRWLLPFRMPRAR